MLEVHSPSGKEGKCKTGCKAEGKCYYGGKASKTPAPKGPPKGKGPPCFGPGVWVTLRWYESGELIEGRHRLYQIIKLVHHLENGDIDEVAPILLINDHDRAGRYDLLLGRRNLSHQHSLLHHYDFDGLVEDTELTLLYVHGELRQNSPVVPSDVAGC